MGKKKLIVYDILDNLNVAYCAISFFILLLIVGVVLVDNNKISEKNNNKVPCFDKNHNLIINAVCIDEHTNFNSNFWIGIFFVGFAILALIVTMFGSFGEIKDELKKL